MNHRICLWGISLTASILGAKRGEETAGCYNPECRLSFNPVSAAGHVPAPSCAHCPDDLRFNLFSQGWAGAWPGCTGLWEEVGSLLVPCPNFQHICFQCTCTYILHKGNQFLFLSKALWKLACFFQAPSLWAWVLAVSSLLN